MKLLFATVDVRREDEDDEDVDEEVDRHGSGVQTHTHIPTMYLSLN